MSNKSTTIKERVLLLADQQTVSKTKFFTELGQSYSSFTGRNKKTAVPSDFLSRLLAKYTQCDPRWLLTGKGKMISTTISSHSAVKLSETQSTGLNTRIKELEQTIKQQDLEILSLQNQLNQIK